MVIQKMFKIEPGDFLEVKQQLEVDGEKNHVAYAQVTKIEDKSVELGLYDHKRLSVGEKTLTTGDIRNSEVFKQTNKEPRQISWEYKKDIE